MSTQSMHSMPANTLRNRALMANALCAVAEEEVHAGRLMGATETIRSIRLLMSDIDILLNGDISHLPYSTLRECKDLLGGLDERIKMIEASLQSGTIH